ncbi:MAG: hypothetical protein HY276_03105 [Ignavibacteriales bacterium]|nr:hypothetical protein [Ignavibacteriales bacterium]MBI3787222.1 hypothetical protein [Ignavibacteriales bacterium]
MNDAAGTKLNLSETVCVGTENDRCENPLRFSPALLFSPMTLSLFGAIYVVQIYEQSELLSSVFSSKGGFFPYI